MDAQNKRIVLICTEREPQSPLASETLVRDAAAGVGRAYLDLLRVGRSNGE